MGEARTGQAMVEHWTDPAHCICALRMMTGIQQLFSPKQHTPKMGFWNQSWVDQLSSGDITAAHISACTVDLYLGKDGPTATDKYSVGLTSKV